MLKEKKAGFLYLFSDKEIRGIAILTFVFSILLVSVDYLSDIVAIEYVFFIAICSYALFQYLFLFFLLFNAWRLFGAFSDKRKKRNDKANLWAIRLVSLGLVGLLDSILLIPALVPFGLLLLLSFITWCAMESYFLCKLAAELASVTHHRFFRFLLYLVLATVFAIYLVFSLWGAIDAVGASPPGAIVGGFDTSWFDWALTLALFVFSLASMGERFLAAERLERLEFEKLSGKEGARVRSTVVFILFALLGFQMFVRGFNFVAVLVPILPFGNIAYYGTKLLFFIPFSLGFLVAVIVKQVRKVPGKA